MRKLEQIAQAEEKKLEVAEQYLEEDAALFDEFLKENDRNASEAIKVYVFCITAYSLHTRRFLLYYFGCVTSNKCNLFVYLHVTEIG